MNDIILPSAPSRGGSGLPGGSCIDIRVHLLPVGDPEDGCGMSEEFMASGRVAAALRACRIDGCASGNEVRDYLLRELDASREVDYAVFLAADGVYRNDRFTARESHLVIPNDYVMDIARENSRVLFGASVHPYRAPKEMMAETVRCISGGAVLFQWIPSIQRIDPEDSRCIPFYIRIAREGVPLLCHTGRPFAGMKSEYANMHYNDPRKLRRALDIGVKVIVSHFCSGFGETQTTGNAYEAELLEMLGSAHKNGWALHTEICGFRASAGRTYYAHVREEISRANASTPGLLFGSGVPLEEREDPSSRDENLFDRHFRLLREAGITRSVVARAEDVLRLGLSREQIAAVKT